MISATKTSINVNPLHLTIRFNLHLQKIVFWKGEFARPIPKDFEGKRRGGKITNYLDILKGYNLEKYLAGIINGKWDKQIMKKINLSDKKGIRNKA